MNPAEIDALVASAQAAKAAGQPLRHWPPSQQPKHLPCVRRSLPSLNRRC